MISQLKGYFYLKPVLALSLTITLYSFVGVPPLIGFFAKQMVLTAAIDSGYIFMSLVAILTSVISAVYYLIVIKQIFFYKPEESLNTELNQLNLHGYIQTPQLSKISEKISYLLSLLSNLFTRIISKLGFVSLTSTTFTPSFEKLSYDSLAKVGNNLTSDKTHIDFSINNIVLSSSLTSITSCLTIIIIGFMLNPAQIINMSSTLAIIQFNI